MAIQMLTHIGVCVSDLERSVAFYRDVLDCTETGRLRADGPKTGQLLGLSEVVLEAVYLERDGFRIELLKYRSPGEVGPADARPMNQLGLTHFSVRVDEFDEVMKRVEEYGGTVLGETRIDSKRRHMAFVCDPDGVRFEVIEAPGNPADIPDPSKRPAE